MTPKHYNPATQRYWYRCIPAETVPENKRTLATRALRFFAADLALSPALPKIIWVIPEDWQIAHEAVSAANRRAFETGEPYQCDCFNEAEDFGGYTKFDQTESIHVRSDLDLGRIPGTIAHELRHLWQDSEFRRGDAAETDASEYELAALTKFVKFMENPHQ